VTLLVYVVVGAVIGAQAYVAVRPLLAAPAFARRNHRDIEVPTAAGIVIVLTVIAVTAVVEVISAAGWTGDPAASPGRTATLIGAVGFGFLGLLDDLAGGVAGGGFRAHVGALRRGRLTTGAVKMIGGALVAVLAVAAIGEATLGWLLVGAAVVALAANVANLLDRAPGRTIKIGLVGFAVLAAVDGASAALAGPGLAMGAAAALAVPDLQEQAMLGDTGANVLGAVVGLAAVVVLGRAATVVLLVALVVLNVASEWVSFSAVIDRSAPLRWFDRLGSKR
jgi:UDP-N-acetylmuramyl pentapeptide phosphotransferase/UDP-N-acetylglucosamine-1-phosphate transferase